MKKLSWYLKQIIPLTYWSAYGVDNKRQVSIWKMWFGRCYNVRILLFLILMILTVTAKGLGQSAQTTLNEMWTNDPFNIGMESVSGKTPVRLSGHNHALAATAEVVGHISTVQGYVKRGTILAIKAASASDDTSGTGIRSVKITGLDSLFAEQNETIILQGSDSVLTTNKYVRVFSVVAMTAGSGGVAAGAITITSSHAGADTSLLLIVTGESSAQSAIYTVPAGKTLYVVEFHASSATGILQTITILSRDRITDESYRPFVEKLAGQIWLSAFHLPCPLPLVFEAYTDVEIRGIGNTGNIVAGLSGWIE